jgi:hypothetical protein
MKPQNPKATQRTNKFIINSKKRRANMKACKSISRLVIFGMLLLFFLSPVSCDKDKDPDPCPNGTTVDQTGEFEPNNQADSANLITFWIPEDPCTTLQITGRIRSDGSVFGGPNGDAFDLFSFILSNEGTYDFELSEITTFDLDLELFTRESFSGNRIPGVNYFSSTINAPSEGNIEFFTATLRPGVEYFIQVRAWDTDDFSFSYSVFVEQELQ